MKRFFIILALSAAPSLYADQFAYVQPETARKAVDLLMVHDYLLELCEPCGDTKGEVLVVTRVEAADVNYKGLHEVQVNGRGVDLAYIFFREDNVWKNVAIRLGLSPHGVTGEVPAEAVAQIPASRKVKQPARKRER